MLLYISGYFEIYCTAQDDHGILIFSILVRNYNSCIEHTTISRPLFWGLKTNLCIRQTGTLYPQPPNLTFTQFSFYFIFCFLLLFYLNVRIFSHTCLLWLILKFCFNIVLKMFDIMNYQPILNHLLSTTTLLYEQSSLNWWDYQSMCECLCVCKGPVLEYPAS